MHLNNDKTIDLLENTSSEYDRYQTLSNDDRLSYLDKIKKKG